MADTLIERYLTDKMFGVWRRREQVERYWKHYGMVLVTNFRAFVLIGKGPTGQPAALESFTLAESESEFWRLAAPQDVAAILASCAHDARLRIEKAELPAVTSLRQALEDALGLHFSGPKGEHFFRSTLVQTLVGEPCL